MKTTALRIGLIGSGDESSDKLQRLLTEQGMQIVHALKPGELTERHLTATNLDVWLLDLDDSQWHDQLDALMDRSAVPIFFNEHQAIEAQQHLDYWCRNLINRMFELVGETPAAVSAPPPAVVVTQTPTQAPVQISPQVTTKASAPSVAAAPANSPALERKTERPPEQRPSDGLNPVPAGLDPELLEEIEELEQLLQNSSQVPLDDIDDLAVTLRAPEPVSTVAKAPAPQAAAKPVTKTTDAAAATSATKPSPTQTAPTPAIPTPAAPAPAPAQNTPAQSTAAKATPAQPASTQTAPAQTAAKQSAPVQTAPTQSAPAQSTRTQPAATTTATLSQPGPAAAPLPPTPATKQPAIPAASLPPAAAVNAVATPTVDAPVLAATPAPATTSAATPATTPVSAPVTPVAEPIQPPERHDWPSFPAPKPVAAIDSDNTDQAFAPMRPQPAAGPMREPARPLAVAASTAASSTPARRATDGNDDSAVPTLIAAPLGEFEPELEFEALSGDDVPVLADAIMDDAVVELEVPLLESVAEATEFEVVPETSPGLPCDLWVLGASLGGPAALKRFFTAIDQPLPISFLLVQHIDAHFLPVLGKILEQANAFYNVQILARPGLIEPGALLLAPIERRLRFLNAGQIVLSGRNWSPPYAPCIDDVLLDVAAAYPGQVNTIVFSGMGADGVNGARAVQAAGGEIWLQEAGSCASSVMPDAIQNAGLSRYRATPEQLATRLMARYRPALTSKNLA